MATIRYQCPNCNHYQRLKKVHQNGKHPTVCKNCKTSLYVYVAGQMVWKAPEGICKAVTI